MESNEAKKFPGLQKDGTYIYYRYDSEMGKEVPIVLVPGKDGVTKEWILMLGELDHRQQLDDRYEDEAKDTLVEKMKSEIADNKTEKDEYYKDPIANLEDKHADVFAAAFPEEKKPTERELVVSKFREEKLLPQQQDLFYKLIDEQMTYQAVADEENAIDGGHRTAQAIYSRWKKIVAKGEKMLSEFV